MKTQRPRNPRTTGAANGRIPRQPSIVGPDGRRIRLADLPLTAYALGCGCTGRGLGIERGDHLFCETHQTDSRVSTILA